MYIQSDMGKHMHSKVSDITGHSHGENNFLWKQNNILKLTFSKEIK